MGFVYVMPDVRAPVCKIGHSKNPRARLVAVRSQWKADVTLFAAIACEEKLAVHVESMAHCLLSNEGLHDHHEWFRATPQQALWAIYTAKKMVAVRRRKNGNHKWATRKAPSSENFPLFHNKYAGYVPLPVWRPSYGLN